MHRQTLLHGLLMYGGRWMIEVEEALSEKVGDEKKRIF